jgi:CelD/BcsL family acetyltransferase involved in cellulose biosynthesis
MPSMADVKIIHLDQWDARWVAFTANHSKAHIFHHPAWTSLLADCYGFRPFVVAVIDGNDNIGAGIPMMEVNHLLTGRRWISLPFTDFCAPLYTNEEMQRCLINSIIDQAQDQRTPRIELRWEFPPNPAIRTYSRQVLHTLPLSTDSESVARRFHSTHRRNIGVAQKRGVRVEQGTKREHLEEFYKLHLQTRRRQGIPIQPRLFFDLLSNHLIEKGLGFILLAYKDDECLAAAVFLNWQHTLTYKYGASVEDGLNLRPNNLLFWTAIRWGCENGYTLFDMGKTDTTNKGLRAYKSGWGAQEMPLAYSTLSVEIPHSKEGKIMAIMQIFIRNSPLWVCRTMGELLYRNFG